ncbi:DUF72 domain-containing protein [Roseateles sp.]|uniref:DUF72 domain-containing protein n=1 Tax=Roseateles sp. TaxID=1971397 RepID=UPI0039C8FCFA
MAPRIGTAGWSVPAGGPEAGTQLQRYAAVLDGVEINSSFHRPHRRATYERWAASTPAAFRFSVKLPRRITHELRLAEADEALARFLDEAAGLGPKWAVALAQLPPSLAFDARVAGRFFERLRRGFDGAMVCEPRHASWFTAEAQALLSECRVCRAAADPARHPGAGEPGGWLGQVSYGRWHGSPRIYRSSYDEAWLRDRAAALRALPDGVQGWCIFDNTASGAAWANALSLRGLLGGPFPVRGTREA